VRRSLIELHERRWAGASSAFAGARRAFHHDFARLALEAGWLRLWLLEVAGAPVAAWLGYRFAGTESYYQAGRDPRWDARGVGAILLHHTMRAAADDGIATYRLLRGGEDYKARYASGDPGVGSVAVAGSPAGRLVVAAAGAALRARAARRRRRAAAH
jgi:CelD/BcsL family acetyltransferase involved in cellulose biosynthesis